MQAEILLTLKLQQKLFADPRRISLLKHIALSGSISQGAKDAGISYKSAWDAINDMNQLSEHMLVERATGGKGGGGAVEISVSAPLPPAIAIWCNSMSTCCWPTAKRGSKSR